MRQKNIRLTVIVVEQTALTRWATHMGLLWLKNFLSFIDLLASK